MVSHFGTSVRTQTGRSPDPRERNGFRTREPHRYSHDERSRLAGGDAMRPLTAKCPVADRERGWIQESMAWFRGQFGEGPLSAPVIVPTSE